LTIPGRIWYTIATTTSWKGYCNGKESSTEEQVGLSATYQADIALRLQQIVAGWHGAERNQQLSALHDECLTAAGPGGRHLLPVYLLLVENLDETNVRTALKRANGRLRGIEVRFRVRVAGRFDAALVPFGSAGEPPNRWLLALEERLPIRDQVALYGHASGHLLLNREQLQLGNLPPLDPRDGYAHHDTLAELRLLEAIRQPLDRRVLETYPLLTALLAEQEEPLTALDSSAIDLRQRLAHYGWRGELVEIPYVFTKGRVYLRGATPQHGKKLRVDALLRGAASLPIAAVQTIHAGETRDVLIQRLTEYAHRRLAVPFAYMQEEDGSLLEFDWTTGDEPAQAILSEFPTRDALLNRWMASLGLSDRLAKNALTFPYQLSGPRPRYYQEAAINRAVIAVLQAKRQLRPPRILLTLATGTGKTKVAFQLLWKLKRTRAIRNILFVTDRDYLLSQAMDNEFAPFGDARTRILGEATTSRDVVFATYQAIADSQTTTGLYRNYSHDFFDVIVVDECHRGSAQADSRWRDILEYFENAVQIGLTATPLSNETVQTDDYFGDPLYIYSLRTGINDGFLAPYRVRYILMGPMEEPTQHSENQPSGIPGSIASSSPAEEAHFDPDANAPEREIIEQTASTLVARTPIIAQHLAGFLRQTDPLAKTIVFCADQAHAEQMREELELACAGYVTRYPGYVARIVSDEGVEGKRALGRFSTPEERIPVIVTTSRLLSTGVDIPTCKNIVLARPVNSMVEFKQIIGRGSRLYEPDKTWFTIIDYAGAIKLFFDPSFDGDPELVEVESLMARSQQLSDESASVPEVTSASEAILALANAGTMLLPPEQENNTVVLADQSSQAAILPAMKESEADGAAGSPVYVVKEAGMEYPPDQEGERSIRQDNSSGSITVEVAEAGNGYQQTPAIAAPVNQEQAPGVFQETAPGLSGEPAPPPVPIQEPPRLVKHTRSGQTIGVIGEDVYDLAPDGKTLLKRSSYREYAAIALQSLVGTPTALRARWLQKEQREALRDSLEEEGVDLQALAEALHLHDVDPLDALLYAAFGRQPLTRKERVEKVYREHADFFNRYQPQASNILHTVLSKYEVGEAQDVSDSKLLRVPPLSDRGTSVELAKAFGGGAAVRAALKKLQEILYSE
jgi:type I restriction enzyme R subunit